MPAQKIGGKRVILRPKLRRVAVTGEAASAGLHIAAAHASIVPLPPASAALQAAMTQLGLPYGITGCRCAVQPCSRRDCSGLIYFGINKVSGSNLCGSSFGIAQVAREHGTIIPKAQALWTPGAIGVRNPWGSPNAIGSNGHTWWIEGNGVNSIEEGGHATGCYRGQADKPGDVIFLLWPSLAYDTPRRIGDGEMILQTKPNGDLKPSTIKGRHAGHLVAPDGLSVLGVNGGSVKGDSPASDVGPGVRRWEPIAVGRGQSISIARRANGTGLICTRSDGVEVSQDYS